MLDGAGLAAWSLYGGMQHRLQPALERWTHDSPLHARDAEALGR